MKEHPILFSAPMVRAILDGRKTQTRRVCKGQRELSRVQDFQLDRCPYGQIRDRLWVKETFVKTDGMTSTPDVFYRASENEVNAAQLAPWKPSIFMPRSLSRITLEITAVRVERLHEITEGDAIAEGFHPCSDGNHGNGGCFDWYRDLWDSINTKTHPWASNPWVWVVTFRRRGAGVNDLNRKGEA